MSSHHARLKHFELANALLSGKEKPTLALESGEEV